MLKQFTISTVLYGEIYFFIIIKSSIQFDDVRVIQFGLYLDLSTNLVLHRVLHNDVLTDDFESKVESSECISTIYVIIVLGQEDITKLATSNELSCHQPILQW